MTSSPFPPLPAIEITGFTDKFESIYLKAYRIHFEQAGKTREFDLALRHSSVATLLYHRDRKEFLCVRQFRPAIFVNTILKLEENRGKKMEEVYWAQYDRELGCTIELCAGIIDKDLPLVDIAREEIEEECGYKVRTEDIHHIASYIVGMDESGSPQHLFYAEIDDSMRLGEGGGNAEEGEFIYKVWLSESSARSFLDHPDPHMPPGGLYAFLWWFDRQDRRIPSMNKESLVDWPPCPSSFPLNPLPPIDNLRFTKDPPTNRFHPVRMFFNINGIARSWDLAPCGDSACVLLYNTDRRQLILNQRFRPAVLIGRYRNLPQNKGRDVTTLDWPSAPREWPYTVELCSGHVRPGESVSACAVRNVAAKAGYRIAESSLRFLTKSTIGISQGGDKLSIFYAEVREADAVKDYVQFEDVQPYPIKRDAALDLILARQTPGPPVVHYAIRWFLSRVP